MAGAIGADGDGIFVQICVIKIKSHEHTVLRLNATRQIKCTSLHYIAFSLYGNRKNAAVDMAFSPAIRKL